MKKQKLEDKLIIGTSILLIGALGFVQTDTFKNEIGSIYDTQISQYSNHSTINNSYYPNKVETFIPYQR